MSIELILGIAAILGAGGLLGFARLIWDAHRARVTDLIAEHTADVRALEKDRDFWRDIALKGLFVNEVVVEKAAEKPGA